MTDNLHLAITYDKYGERGQNVIVSTIQGKILANFYFDGIAEIREVREDEVFTVKDSAIWAVCEEETRQIILIKSRPPYISGYSFDSLKNESLDSLQHYTFGGWQAIRTIYFNAEGKPVSYVIKEGGDEGH